AFVFNGPSLRRSVQLQHHADRFCQSNFRRPAGVGSVNRMIAVQVSDTTGAQRSATAGYKKTSAKNRLPPGRPVIICKECYLSVNTYTFEGLLLLKFYFTTIFAIRLALASAGTLQVYDSN